MVTHQTMLNYEVTLQQNLTPKCVYTGEDQKHG